MSSISSVSVSDSHSAATRLGTSVDRALDRCGIFGATVASRAKVSNVEKVSVHISVFSFFTCIRPPRSPSFAAQARYVPVECCTASTSSFGSSKFSRAIGVL